MLKKIIVTGGDGRFAKELKKIKFLEAWAILGPIVGILIGLIF